MQKKFLLSVLTIICVLVLAVGVTACGHRQQDNAWAYDYDENYHWRTSPNSGEIKDKQTHNFCEIAPDSGLLELCACGAHLGEFNSFKVIFEHDDSIAVRVYPTQDATQGYLTDYAFARDSDTGALVNDGDGQVNFEIELPTGYRIGDISVTPKENYKNLKDAVKDGNPNAYRITKITGELTVTISSELDVTNNLPLYDLPVIAINTENNAPILDRENYVACDVSLLNTEDEYCFMEKSAGIRLRGNSTFYQPKKPYRIKFDSKQSLFGWTANKSWVLLAMYNDFSNIKDYTAFQLANAIATENSAFVPHAKHVEVYLNGIFQGLYLLTDQVNENVGRTGVKTDFDATTVEVPFLVEWDEYAQDEGVEDIDWFKIVNEDGVISYYKIKYPEVDERYTQAQFDYIKNYIVTVNILCHDPNVTQDQFEAYIDLPSFIDYYLVQEVMGQIEINWKSIHMSKAIDGKLVMGPVWDFDYAAGGSSGDANKGTELSSDWYSKTNWYIYMLKVDWFQEAVRTRWAEIQDAIAETVNNLQAYKAQIMGAGLRNAELWDFDVDDSLLDFVDYYDWVLEFINYRVKVITELLGMDD